MERPPAAGFWLALVGLALAGRLAAYLAFNFLWYEGEFGHPDSAYYHGEALEPAEGGLTELFRRGGYEAFLRVLYRAFGTNHHLGELLNVAAGALLPAMVFLIAWRALDRRSALFAALFTAVDPGLVYWSTQLLKDSFLLLLFLLVVWAGLRPERVGPSRLALTGVFLLALGTLRPELALLLGVVLAVHLLRAGALEWRTTLALAMAGAAAAWWVVSPWLVEHAPGRGLFSPREAIQLVNSVRVATDVPSHVPFFAASLPKDTFGSPGALLAFLATAPLHFLFAPFPWHARSAYELASLPYICWWYLQVGCFLIGLARARPVGRRAQALLLAIVAIALPLTLLITSTAPFVRWRLPAAVLMAVFAGRGLREVLRWMGRCIGGARHVARAG